MLQNNALQQERLNLDKIKEYSIEELNRAIGVRNNVSMCAAFFDKLEVLKYFYETKSNSLTTILRYTLILFHRKHMTLGKIFDKKLMRYL